MNVEQVKYNIKFQMNGLVLAQNTKNHTPTNRRVRCQGFLKDRLFARFSTKDSLKIDFS